MAKETVINLELTPREAALVLELVCAVSQLDGPYQKEADEIETALRGVHKAFAGHMPCLVRSDMEALPYGFLEVIDAPI